MPLLYLGDLFERRENPELLCLLALGAETGSVGLVRLATLPAYGATREDALASFAGLAKSRRASSTLFPARRRSKA